MQSACLFVCVWRARELYKVSEREISSHWRMRTCCRCISSESSLLIMHSNEAKEIGVATALTRMRPANTIMCAAGWWRRSSQHVSVCIIAFPTFIWQLKETLCSVCETNHESLILLPSSVSEHTLLKMEQNDRDFRFGVSFFNKINFRYHQWKLFIDES